MSEYIKREDVENMLVDADLIFDGEYLGYCIDDILIDKIPAADVVEVKHGQWQLDEEESCGHTEYIYTCSACRNCTAWGETEKTRYCPYCGAKMDLED